MSKIRRRMSRAVAGATAGLLAVSGAVTFASPASAVNGFEFDRLAGVDRYATAATIALSSFSTSATVLLANGQSDDPRTARNEGHFPDALAANYLAGANNAPTLLTTETSLPGATTQALRDLQANNVVIIGGTAAVSSGQEQSLRNAGYSVRRIGGATRYDTAAAVARTPALGYIGSVDGRKTAIVASGVNFPDALVAGPLGYASKFPITITDPQRLSPETRDALRDLGIQNVLIPGGTSAVSESVATEIRSLGITVQRFAGINRSETAALVAEYALTKLGFTNKHVNLALGLRFPDALAGGPHAGKDKAPILLTASVDSVGAATLDFLEAHDGTLEGGHIFGGTAAVSAAAERDAEAAAQGEADPEPQPNSSTVTVTSSTVEAGKPVTGQVTGENIASVRVSGCGLNNEPVNDTSTGTDGIQFSETIPSTQPEGKCTLTFTTTFEDGTTKTQTIEITVTKTGNASNVILNSTTVEAGTPITGRVEGRNIQSVTVSGCGLNNEPVNDTNPNTETIEFSEVIPATQPAGTCTLTFRTTFKDGTITSQAFTITVTRPGAVAPSTSVSTRPELLKAEVVQTTTNNNGTSSTSDDFAETTVRFTFDEEVFGKAPVASSFHLVQFDGDPPYDDGRRAIVEAGGNSVLVTFGTETMPVGAVQLNDLSLATVDAGAVLDNEGQTNPIQDAALDATAADPVVQAGITEAPDLVSVQNFRDQNATATATAVDFVFDEEAFVQKPEGFHLVFVDGTTDVTCDSTEGTGPAESGGTRTITVVCPNPVLTGSITASQVARGYVEADTVNDVAEPNLAAPGNGNPLEAAEVSNSGNSGTPDLVSGQFLPTADRASGDSLEVLYVFDEPVFVGIQGGFKLYKTDGSEATSNSARRLEDPTRVIATFPGASVFANRPDPLENAVGISVVEGAVTEASGTTRPNQEDEVGIENPSARVLIPGRTENPDLVRVEIGESTSGDRTGIYIFDESVLLEDANPRDFKLYRSDGQELTCSSAAASGDTVTCTSYTKSLSGIPVPASSAEVASAVLGTVADGAVLEQSTTSQGPNPNGAEPVNGGTGSPQQ